MNRHHTPVCACLGISIWAVLWAGAAAAEQSPAPIALHPQNGHYFLWRGRPTILITSGEHYGALLNLDFDYVRYFDTLAADGLNLTRLFSGTYREIPDSSASPTTRWRPSLTATCARGPAAASRATSTAAPSSTWPAGIRPISSACTT